MAGREQVMPRRDVPVPAPGERSGREAPDHPTSGVAAGMLVPDAADPALETVRVVRE
jgi:hypothetical protein